jgi:hypothetical protein
LREEPTLAEKFRPSGLSISWEFPLAVQEMRRSRTCDPSALMECRSNYAKGRNALVTPLEGPAYRKLLGKLEVTACGLGGIES